MNVIFQKPDLDTCMTALLKGVTRKETVVPSPGDAAPTDLMNPAILCIECGGSGEVYLNNFDHHISSDTLSSACVQAMHHLKVSDKPTRTMVDYIAHVDQGRPFDSPIAFPSLSNLFSGLRLVEKDDLVEQFFKGIELLKCVRGYGYNPFEPMPMRAEWEPYIEAKHKNHAQIHGSLCTTLFYETAHHMKLGFCCQKATGGLGEMFQQGCDIAVLYSEAFGVEKRPKYTVAVKDDIELSGLLTDLNRVDPGWGGHRKIIGSPRERETTLKPDQLIEMLCKRL